MSYIHWYSRASCSLDLDLSSPKICMVVATLGPAWFKRVLANQFGNLHETVAYPGSSQRKPQYGHKCFLFKARLFLLRLKELFYGFFWPGDIRFGRQRIKEAFQYQSCSMEYGSLIQKMIIGRDTNCIQHHPNLASFSRLLHWKGLDLQRKMLQMRGGIVDWRGGPKDDVSIGEWCFCVKCHWPGERIWRPWCT